MQKMQKQKKLSQNQKGQSIMEYIVLTSMIGIFCLVAVKNFGSSMKSKIQQMDRKISRQINIGR